MKDKHRVFVLATDTEEVVIPQNTKKNHLSEAITFMGLNN
jgi:hypothetical protein